MTTEIKPVFTVEEANTQPVNTQPVKPGYHLEHIPRGTYGEISKIIEETAELKDAMEQGQKLMCLVELSDLYGAIEGYLEKEYQGKITMTDIHNMAYATIRAFESGQRK